MALSESAVKDISQAGYKSGQSLYRLYASQGNEVVSREAKRVHAELVQMMVTMYGKPHHTGHILLHSMRRGYQDAMSAAQEATK